MIGPKANFIEGCFFKFFIRAIHIIFLCDPSINFVPLSLHKTLRTSGLEGIIEYWCEYNAVKNALFLMNINHCFNKVLYCFSYCMMWAMHSQNLKDYFFVFMQFFVIHSVMISSAPGLMAS